MRQGGHDAAFSPDGKKLAVAGYDGVWVWSFPKGEKLFEFLIPLSRENLPGTAWKVVFAPDHSLLANIRRE